MITSDSNETKLLLQRAARGEREACGVLLTRHEARLRRMVALRLDRRMQGRLDVSDVIQDVNLEAAKHLSQYARQPAMSFFLWLRGIAGNKLRELHRRHLGTQMRAASREISLHRNAIPETTSAALAEQLLGHHVQPSEVAMNAEIRLRLQETLNRMEPIDREILALRHFEELTNSEAALVLNIDEKAASKRYLRALERLRDILTYSPGVFP